MTTTPDWVLSLTDAVLNQRFGTATVARAGDYVRQHRITSIQVSQGTHVLGRVRGDSYRMYEVIVVCRAGPASLVTTCTCPQRSGCKHVVAVILQLRGSARRASAPQWQRTLSPLLRRTGEGQGGAPLALQVNRSAIGYTVRPLTRGQRDGWIKSGAGWDDIRFYGGRFDPAQREALIALVDSRQRNEYGYGFRPDALPLSELRADAWVLLRDSLATGVPLLAGTDSARAGLPQPRLSLDPFEASLMVAPHADGLELRPTLTSNGQPLTGGEVELVGRPAHGVAILSDDDLVLGALSRALDRAEQDLFAAGPVHVPAADATLFASGFLPQLRQRLPVLADGVDLPEALPPTLHCRVTFDDRTASVHWDWRYRVGDQEHRLGLTVEPTEPPLRDPHAERAVIDRLPEGPWVSRTAGGARQLRPAFLTGRALFEFVSRALPALRGTEGVEVEVNQPVPDFRHSDEAPVVSLTVTDAPAGDWFNLAVEVTVAGEQVPFVPLFAALTRGDDHLVLDSGLWFDLDQPELAHLRELVAEASTLVDRDSTDLRLRPEHAGLWDELVRLGVVAEQSQAWRESVDALLDLDELPQVPTPSGLKAELRPYQTTGFHWLSFLWRARLGGILADEMGLGKTLQALALVLDIQKADEPVAPVLVVAPTSVIATWQAEAARFAPDLRVVAITETQARRRTPLADAVAGAQLVITSYTLLRLEAEHYQAMTFGAVLLDEAQFVKNHASKAYQAVRRLQTRLKVALTGTPLENNLMDLWSLLSITAPGLFPDPKVFTEFYRRPIESGSPGALERLHRRIRPLILRRTKSAVATELPEKQEQLVPVELAPAHRKLYERHLARERQKVLGLVGDLNRNRMTILRSLTLLRQLSLSPSLIDPEYQPQSAKLDVLVDMLTEITAEGHRALIFSQFTGFLALVRERLKREGFTFEYLDGRTRDRAARVEAFRTGSADAFLISLKAGGFGLTLTEADYVFILDPWWNPAAETQAIDRAHRIGQDKPVNVYRLVAADTIEDKVVELQQHKRDLFAQVVGSGSDVAAPLSADDIRGLLEA